MSRRILFLLPCAAFAGPCDIFEESGTPCVAAHAVTRLLYSSYRGPLYQLKRLSDNATLDIGVADDDAGIADSAAHAHFCWPKHDCVILRIYDQSGRGNHLDPGPPGQNTPIPDEPVNATKHQIFLTNQKTKRPTMVYGARFDNKPPYGRQGNQGYRNDRTSGVPVKDEPETIYAVLNGKHFSYHCCFDYGNAETSNNDDGASTMEALYFGSHKSWPPDTWGPGGPDAGEAYVMADLENGIWAGNATTKPVGIDTDFVVGMLKAKSGNHWALKQADAQTGDLRTTYAGVRPPGYELMNKQGAIILGIGGDNSNRGRGTFYEGVMVAGFTSEEADAAVQEDIKKAGYAVFESTSSTVDGGADADSDGGTKVPVLGNGRVALETAVFV